MCAAFVVAYRLPFGRADAEALCDALGQVLIHGDGASKIAAAGVGDAEQVERRLNAAVFAAGAVHADEHQIRRAAKLEDAETDEASGLPFALGADFVKVGHLAADACLRDRGQLVKIALGIAVEVLDAEEHIHQNGLVAEVSKRAADQRGTGDRNVAFGAQASAHDDDFHLISSFL